MAVVEAPERLHCVELDRYCSVFSKSFDGLHLGCLVTKTRTFHLLFAFSSQLAKFVRVLDNLIRVDNITRLTNTQTIPIFTPFLSAQVVDFRKPKNLRGSR
jgi:hypothetical protein